MSADLIPDVWNDLDVVPVGVASVFAGVWGRFTGHTPAGETVTVSGAVVAGPTLTDVDGRRVLAVLIRDYLGNPDRLLFTDPGAAAELVDDPADHIARAACALAPVFAPGAARVDLLRRNRAGEWVPEVEYDVTPARLTELERTPDPDLVLAGVYRDDLPVPGLIEVA